MVPMCNERPLLSHCIFISSYYNYIVHIVSELQQIFPIIRAAGQTLLPSQIPAASKTPIKPAKAPKTAD